MEHALNGMELESNGWNHTGKQSTPGQTKSVEQAAQVEQESG